MWAWSLAMASLDSRWLSKLLEHHMKPRTGEMQPTLTAVYFGWFTVTLCFFLHMKASFPWQVHDSRGHHEDGGSWGSWFLFFHLYITPMVCFFL